jgi:hypothetical protein
VSIYKRGSRWCYDIKIKGTRYRGTIPEAQTCPLMSFLSCARARVYSTSSVSNCPEITQRELCHGPDKVDASDRNRCTIPARLLLSTSGA